MKKFFAKRTKRKIDQVIEAASVARVEGEVTNFTLACWLLENLEAHGLHGSFRSSYSDAFGDSMELSPSKARELDPQEFEYFFSAVIVELFSTHVLFSQRDIEDIYSLFNGEDCFGANLPEIFPGGRAEIDTSSFEGLRNSYLFLCCNRIARNPRSPVPDEWGILYLDIIQKMTTLFPQESKAFLDYSSQSLGRSKGMLGFRLRVNGRETALLKHDPLFFKADRRMIFSFDCALRDSYLPLVIMSVSKSKSTSAYWSETLPVTGISAAPLDPELDVSIPKEVPVENFLSDVMEIFEMNEKHFLASEEASVMNQEQVEAGQLAVLKVAVRSVQALDSF